jgi:hypothetical protein
MAKLSDLIHTLVNMSFINEYSLDAIKMTPVNLLILNGEHNQREQWIKSRGARVEQIYSYKKSGSYIRDHYTYEYIDGGRNIGSYKRVMDWIDITGKFHSEDITPNMTNYHLREVNKNARMGQMNYMEGAAFDLALLAEKLPEPYRTGYLAVAGGLSSIMHHYQQEISEYRERNIYSYTFENAINNESDEYILALLAMTVRVPDALFPLGLTARQSIIHQLTGVKPL